MKYILLYIIGFTVISLVPLLATEDENLLEMSLEDLMNIKVSVASKSEESLCDAPSSVTVFTSAEIANLGFRTLEDLLNFVPGFQTTRDIEQGTATRISSRGRASAQSESILFLLNGQRLNDLYTGGVSVLNRLISVNNIKQVEIIRGPGSALYGSNAFLGVVNILTKDEDNDIQLEYGTQNYKSASINISKEIGSSIKASAYVGIFSEDGHEYDNMTDVWGRKDKTRDPSKGFDVLTSIDYKNLTFSTRFMERNVSDFMTFGTISNHLNDENTSQTSFSLDYDFNLFDKFGVSLKTTYSYDHWDAISILIPKDIEIVEDYSLPANFMGGPLLESHDFGFYTDMKYQVLENNNLIFGVSYEQSGIDKVMNVLTHHPVTLDYYGDFQEFDGAMSFNELNDRRILGIYVQDKHNFTDYLAITTGFRYDDYDDFGSSLNPRAAIVFQTPFKSTIKAMYGSAFRAPNFLELYDKNNPVDFGNPKLEAEKVQTVEFAYVQKFDSFQGTVTFFQNKITNMISLDVTTRPVDDNNPLEAYGYVNFGELVTKGIEVELKTSPIKNLLIYCSFTSLFDADALPVSKSFASLAINYSIGNMNLNINGIYRDKMEILPNQDSYFILNASASYKISNNLKLRVSVLNLTDEDYYTFTNLLPNGIANRKMSLSGGLQILL